MSDSVPFISTSVFPLQALTKKYDNEVEMLNRQQKHEVEKLEMAQTNEAKTFIRTLKLKQERELRSFREKQKREMKEGSSRKAEALGIIRQLHTPRYSHMLTSQYP